ncbi:MarR family winged helix-turn-helix transcriptional regulator [Notoacmeibacter ruber]|uniref:MarR family transcriptional regulator n=1 Tax=Notoacmeibacter ruber TaxID=2670375 RepID=A0A3L7JIK6_9HYPH|nr:MarR family transcriptional regulator [Notoacmeibacter ruber]RLQ88322.1 MarR family transcriptional regulator [Notoacmeibacter ruber]
MGDASSPAEHGPSDAAFSGSNRDFARMQELFFFAYRDFTAGPDAILAQYGFGRAHHRVLHFVARWPGLTVADLLEILGITKQSLARVLKQLIDAGHVKQKTNVRDRRQRELYLTEEGEALADALSAPQWQLLEDALQRAGDENYDAIVAFLRSMIDKDAREAMSALTHHRKRQQEGV